MLRIDPHTHPACSDGTDSPSQLMVEAMRAGLGYVDLSDHDTFVKWDEAGTAISSTGVTLIRDVEMSYAANGVGVHPLALLSGPSNEGLLTCIERVRESRAARALKMVEDLSAGYPITWEQVLAFTPKEGPIGRPHITDALVAAGAFDDRSAASVKVPHPSSPYYVCCWASDPIEVVRLVPKTGGIPVLTHPKTRAHQRFLPESVIEDVEEAGFFGTECDHRGHVLEDREAMNRIAKRLGLRIFGSSNYHNTGKPNYIGKNLTVPATIDETVEHAHLEVLHP